MVEFIKRIFRITLIYIRYYVIVPVVRLREWIKQPYNYRNPFEVIYIDPNKINCAIHDRYQRKYSRIWITNVVRKGDWDKDIHSLITQSLFRMIEKRIQDNVEWKDIPEYKNVSERITNGVRSLKCDTLKELNHRLLLCESIAESMKCNGYSTQSQLGSKKIWDEIRVGITRNGEYVLINGRHRLAIARALKLKEVPVIISIKHNLYKNNK